MAESRTYEGNGHRVTVADPENITQAQCIELLHCRAIAWNSWRKEFPVTRSDSGVYKNAVDFSDTNLTDIDLNFSGIYFGERAIFANAKFGYSNFEGSIFGRHARFDNCHFSLGAIFSGASFGGNCHFDVARFSQDAHFRNCEFLGSTSFKAVQFSTHADFSGATFEFDADFESVLLGDSLSFLYATVGGTLNLRAVSWSHIKRLLLAYGVLDIDQRIENAKIEGLKFQAINSLDCRSASISQSIFNDREFLGATNFGAAHKSLQTRKYIRSENGLPIIDEILEPKFELVVQAPKSTVFHTPPSFYGCKLNQDTSFEGVKLPPAKGNDTFARAYRTLKLAFAQQQAIREEQRFFKLEMEEEAARETGWRRWLFRAYRELSDFGFSIGRPVILFFVVAALAALIYGWQAGLVFDSANTHSAALVQFSVASAIPGLEKLSEPAAIRLFGEVSKGSTNYSLPTVLALLTHKAISLLALFLIGLALRNLFKMK